MSQKNSQQIKHCNAEPSAPPHRRPLAVLLKPKGPGWVADGERCASPLTQRRKRMEELIYASATALAKAIRTKEVSAVEVLEAYLRRIDAVNPKLNAVVQLPVDMAYTEAQAADTALARGELKGPLHGVPFTVKDNIDTAGVLCTVGTKGRAAFVPPQDATIVARLRTAGAILLGKTNLPELGLA